MVRENRPSVRAAAEKTRGERAARLVELTRGVFPLFTEREIECGQRFRVFNFLFLLYFINSKKKKTKLIKTTSTFLIL